MLEEMKVINRETVHKILVEYFKQEKVCARFIPHQNIKALHCPFNLLKWLITIKRFQKWRALKLDVSCMIQKQNVRVQSG
jgi:hypothetical protein